MMEMYWQFSHQLEEANMLKRYSRNYSTISEAEQEKLKNSRVCVIGCGGIGGYAAEMLGRIGVGHITAIDGDVFEESNLNRQIYSDSSSLGKSKANEVKENMKKVNPLIHVEPISYKIDSENSKTLLSQADVVIDALDNIETRLLIEKTCEDLNIPLVHGAIAGWYCQVTTIMPGDRTLSLFYKGENLPGIEKKLGNPSFTPALAASVQVSETVKLIIGRGKILRKRMLIIDMLNQDYDEVEIINS
jgi:molybdopterin-synthase adenylyltransferase